jgi:hypothetical protein
MQISTPAAKDHGGITDRATARAKEEEKGGVDKARRGLKRGQDEAGRVRER